jgi:hypothetical protein
MDELRDRFAALERVSVPDLWRDIDRRVAETAEASPVHGRVTWRAQREPHRLSPTFIVLLLSLLLVLALALVTVGSRLPDLWTSVFRAPEGYSAVLVRGLGESEVQVLAAKDGSAERVADVPVSRLGPVQIERPLEASPFGWIALQAYDQAGYEYVVLVDVRNAHATPIVREGTYHGAFTPDGLYWSATNTAYELIDPATGNVTSLPRSVAEDLDWWSGGIDSRMRVAADGAGLLLGDPANTTHDETGRPYPQQWGVLSPAGILSRGLPDLAEGVGTRLISARWGLLQRCEAPAGECDMPTRRSRSIISGPASDGSYRQWGGDPPAGDHVIGASWSVDGGLWLLVDRRLPGERTMVIIHRDEEIVDREVASFAVEHDVDVSFGDLAPDDSLIAFNLWADWPRWQTVIVDTRSGDSRLFDGTLAGFVPAVAANEWVSGSTTTEAGQPLEQPTTGAGSSPPYPALPSLQQQLDFIEYAGAERVQLIHEFEATTADRGSTGMVTLGPVGLTKGGGMSLVCSGPGEVTVTEISREGHESPETHGCLSPGAFGSREGREVGWPSATIRVEYDPSTSWRLVVYDPPYTRQRP